MQFPQQEKGLTLSHVRRTGVANTLLISSVVGIALLAGAWLAISKSSPAVDTNATVSPVQPRATNANSKKFPVVIRKPDGPPRVYTGVNDIHGQPVTVACGTCHATRKPNFDNKSVTDLNEFHGSLAFSHGTVSCLSCHNATDYDALKLADGTRVEFTDVMTLCAQCHSPQTRDYEHGAHGGFNGHWDLTRGSKEKNNCIDCHNPHSPQFPKMQPTFKPRDRFLEKESHEVHE